MGLDLKKIIGSIAPAIGKAIGGPGGTALKILGKAILGNENATESDLSDALAAMTPEQRAEAELKIKAADYEFQLSEARLELEQWKNEVDDRANARARQIAMGDRDHTTPALAWTVTIGFFATLITMLFVTPPAASRDIFLMLIGALIGRFGDVYAYFFGSSKGSARKDVIIAASRKE